MQTPFLPARAVLPALSVRGEKEMRLLFKKKNEEERMERLSVFFLGRALLTYECMYQHLSVALFAQSNPLVECRVLERPHLWQLDT